MPCASGSTRASMGCGSTPSRISSNARGPAPRTSPRPTPSCDACARQWTPSTPVACCWPIVDIMEQTPAIPETCQWALFLRNHDELTLEMVTDDERDYMWNEYAIDPRMRLNLGIRRRLAPLVDNSRRRMELLTSLLLSLHGTPVIYYGDEIGMGDNIYLGDRNGVRTPMQWNGDRNAGFSRADVHALYTPLVADPVYGYQAVNVEAQQRVPSSLLNWMRRLIAIR